MPKSEIRRGGPSLNGRRHMPRTAWRRCAWPCHAIAVACSISSLSCVAPKKPGVVAPTQADRLIQAYSEIQNGRLLILADFEDEKQMGIFQLESASNPGRLARDPKKGRPETGTGALAVALTAPNESVVISSPSQGEWFLKRDWRPYDLLMMAAHAPVAGLTLEVKIVGGVSGSAVEARTETVLTTGWNLLRFDLAEVGEQVPLDDIQEIRLAVMNPPVPPATLYFDDILLAGNRRDLMGDSANQSGILYVQNAGRHWNVGAGGRFEISFHNGQIIRWFNLATDPHRLRNLVRGTSLGPMPVLVEEGKVPRASVQLGDAVVARQRILEMNAVCVVIECLWQFDSKANKAGPAAFEHWMYTIYPTGQIFVSATTSVLHDEGSQQAGMAVNVAWSPTAPTVQIARTEDARSASSASPPATFAVARSADADAALLFIPYSDGDSVQLTELADKAARTTSLIWSKSRTADPTQTYRCQLVLASAIDEAEAAARGIDYTIPGSVRIEVGRAQTGAMFRSDGFDPGTGCFHVATDGNRARIVVEGKKQPSFSPAFQIDGGSDDQVWVYVNYLTHPSVVRGSRGEALFQLPGTVTKEIVVEPLFKKSR